MGVLFSLLFVLTAYSAEKPPARIKTALNNTDLDIIVEVAAEQARLGTLEGFAFNRLQDTSVKDLAQRFQADHEVIFFSLQDLAGKKLPSDKQFHSGVIYLQRTNRKKEQVFLSLEIERHKEMLEKLDNLLEEASDIRLKAILENAEDQARNHLRQAEASLK